MMVIENKFDLQQSVYLKTDSDQKERIVIGILIQNGIQYQLAGGERSTWHYEFEITDEKNVLKTSSE